MRIPSIKICLEALYIASIKNIVSEKKGVYRSIRQKQKKKTTTCSRVDAIETFEWFNPFFISSNSVFCVNYSYARTAV